MYHTTTKKKVKKILSEGVKPQDRSVYKGFFGQQLKDKGKIYAFTDFDDAARWAAKMEFDLKQKTSIIEFAGIRDWERDTHFQSAGVKGKWLKKEGTIPSTNIKGSIDLTLDMKRKLVRTLSTDMRLTKHGVIVPIRKK